jgi:ribosome-associated toxin RatA of RatAB toxin-antitoxin module
VIIAVRANGAAPGLADKPRGGSLAWLKAFCILITALVLLAGPAQASGPGKPQPFSQEQRDWLAGGGVVVRSLIPKGEQRTWFQAAIVVPAPPQRVWRTLLDYEHAAEFVPGLKSCRVLERGPNHDIIEHCVDMFWLIPQVNYVLRVDYQKNKRIDFKKIRGDLEEMKGNWTLAGLDQGRKTMITYTVYLDLGFSVPRWLVSMAMHADLPEFMLAIRDRVLGVAP